MASFTLVPSPMVAEMQGCEKRTKWMGIGGPPNEGDGSRLRLLAGGAALLGLFTGGSSVSPQRSPLLVMPTMLHERYT